MIGAGAPVTGDQIERLSRAVDQLAHPAVSLDDRIRNVATLASVTLALTALFVNHRLARLDEDRPTLESWNRASTANFVLDLVLLLFVACVLVAIGPLMVDAFPPELGTSAAVMRSMLCLLWVGFLGVAGLQAYILGARVKPTISSTKSQREIENRFT